MTGTEQQEALLLRRIRRLKAGRARRAPASTTSTADYFGAVARRLRRGRRRPPICRTTRTIRVGHRCCYELDVQKLGCVSAESRSPTLIGLDSSTRSASRSAFGARTRPTSACFFSRSSRATARRRCSRATRSRSRYSTYSDQLAKDVQLLLLEFGVVSQALPLREGRDEGRDHEPSRRAPLHARRRLPRREAAQARAALDSRSPARAAR